MNLRIPDKTVVDVFKKLSQNSSKEHNENSESEQPITQHIYRISRPIRRTFFTKNVT